jgi:hypothetical protein
LDALIYEDNAYGYQGPNQDRRDLIFIFLSTVFVIVLNMVLPQSPDSPDLKKFLLCAILIATSIYLGFWWIGRPRKYQIFDDKVRIAFGSPFHFDIPLNNVDYTCEGDWTEQFKFNRHYTTSLFKNIVNIARNKGMMVNITPNNPELFVENLRKALAEWKKYHIDV